MDIKEVMRKKTEQGTANLSDYEGTCRNFDYGRFCNELVWFDNRHINAGYNAVTKNALSERKNKIALYWQGEDETREKYTFLEAEQISNQVGNYLKSIGVSAGDRVFIFLPRIPLLYFSFLAILKIGAVAGTLFAAFGPQALYDRLEQSGAKVLITNSEMAKRIAPVRKKLPDLKRIVLIDKGFTHEVSLQSTKLHVVETHEDTDAFMLYTSGTTGKPKGVVHRHGAIMHEYLTAKWILDLKESDVYWCTADPGWVTGIAYEILGSWACGASTVVHAGRFEPAKWYQILSEYKVNVWYTAPTAVRMLAAAGSELAKKYDLSSLRHIL